MLTIFDSTTQRQSSNRQHLMNDLATRWDWCNITRNGENVTELWASETVCLKLGSDASNLDLYNESNDLSCSKRFDSNEYRIIQTDYSTMVCWNGNFICVANTVDIDGNESCGFVISYSTNSYGIICITDTMRNTDMMFSSNAILTRYITQLIPICNANGKEIFENIYIPTFRDANMMSGKILLNDTYYYSYGESRITLKYTP